VKITESNNQEMEKPQIWHYGLVARDWAEFITEGGEEAAYFKNIIAASGEPALDLGCGSGRLLVPLLQAGLDVDGCDFSPDMLAVCREGLDAAGLESGLYQQAMHELDLPRRYRTIFACGVIGLGGSKQLTRRAMQRCCDHLRPGGMFAFDYQAPWNDPPYWEGWLPENRRSLPLDWFEPAAERQTMSDGDELENTVRIISQDPLEGIAVRQIRFRLWRGETLVKEEIHTMQMEAYSKNELLLMLEFAGFREVRVFGDYRAEPAGMDHKKLVFVATK
jgi:SAM-dependent methyltransferase